MSIIDAIATKVSGVFGGNDSPNEPTRPTMSEYLSPAEQEFATKLAMVRQMVGNKRIDPEIIGQQLFGLKQLSARVRGERHAKAIRRIGAGEVTATGHDAGMITREKAISELQREAAQTYSGQADKTEQFLRSFLGESGAPEAPAGSSPQLELQASVSAARVANRRG